MQYQRGRSPMRVRRIMGSQGGRGGLGGISIDEVKEGNVYNGYVTWRTRAGMVFVDYGSQRDGILKPKRSRRNLYRKGVEVVGMMCIAVDQDSGRATFEPDPVVEHDMVSRAPPPSRGSSVSTRGGRSQSRNRSRSSSGFKRRPSARNSQIWEHEDGTPIEEYQEGEEVEGSVVVANRYGVFVNFGCVKDGRLILPVGYEREFRVGEQIAGMRIAALNKVRKRVDLKVNDLEGTIETLSMERVPLEELEEGIITEGMVSEVGQYGIFVNIGATKDGKLRVPKKNEGDYMRGETVPNMRIESIDLEKQRFSLVIDDPQQEVAEPIRALPPAKTSTSNKVAPKSVPAQRASAKKAPLALPEPQHEEEAGAIIPLEEICVGELANGIVVSVTGRGVMVDIGAEVDGTLRLSADLRQRFQINDMVEGMVVEELDLKRRQVILSMDDPELAVVDGRPASPPEEVAPPRDHVRPAGGPKAQAKPHAKVKAKAKAN